MKLINHMLCNQHADGTKGVRQLNGKSIRCPYETEISREIRILSEVEKIWIIHDVDNSGSLDRQEVEDYIKFMAGDDLELTDK